MDVVVEEGLPQHGSLTIVEEGLSFDTFFGEFGSTQGLDSGIDTNAVNAGQNSAERKGGKPGLVCGTYDQLLEGGDEFNLEGDDDEHCSQNGDDETFEEVPTGVEGSRKDQRCKECIKEGSGWIDMNSLLRGQGDQPHVDPTAENAEHYTDCEEDEGYHHHSLTVLELHAILELISGIFARAIQFFKSTTGFKFVYYLSLYLKHNMMVIGRNCSQLLYFNFATPIQLLLNDAPDLNLVTV